MAQPTPEISIVVPGLNEAKSLPQLAEQIEAALGHRERYELILVDDGSTDESWEVIQQLAQKPWIRGIRLRANFGKAMALTAGFRRSRGEIVVMMDADLQDDPADLPNFIAKVREGLDVVVGWKVNRRDPLNRRLLSKIFNGTVALTTKVRLHDMNCGFKAYRREVVETTPIYADLFRFIPALAQAQGYRVAEIPVKHHAREHGRSRYGLERVLRGFFDLMSVLFLTRYARRPMHFFGLIGLLLFALGFGIDAYLSVLWFLGEGIGQRPLLLLGAVLMLVGVQLASLGFIGEFMTYQQEKQSYRENLPIAAETAPPPSPAEPLRAPRRPPTMAGGGG